MQVHDLLFRNIEKDGLPSERERLGYEKYIQLLEHRVQELEREIAAASPDLAAKLGIKS